MGKRPSNRRSAERYRQRKKIEEAQLREMLGELQTTNTRLKHRHESLETEKSILEGLIALIQRERLPAGDYSQTTAGITVTASASGDTPDNSESDRVVPSMVSGPLSTVPEMNDMVTFQALLDAGGGELQFSPLAQGTVSSLCGLDIMESLPSDIQHAISSF